MTSITQLMIKPETLREHKARWFVYAGGYGQPLEKLPHTGQMRGAWTGWDVACSCGWESRTGGATKARVIEALFDHRLDVQADAELKAEARAAGVDPDDQSAYTRFLMTKILKG